MTPQKISICTFSRKSARPAFPVYILSHGLNAGKTSFNPEWENAFVISCKDEEERDHMHTLCTALFYADRYRAHLKGSVILFLRIGEARRLIERAWYIIQTYPNAAGELIKVSHLIIAKWNTRRQAEKTEELFLVAIKSICHKYI